MVLYRDRTQMRCQCCGPHWGQLVMQRLALGRRLPATLAERCLSTLLLIRLPVGASWWRTLSMGVDQWIAGTSGDVQSESGELQCLGGVSEPSQWAWGGV
eukprot:818417-Rhodomonas_salina.1